jgi:hypothetical protein
MKNEKKAETSLRGGTPKQPRKTVNSGLLQPDGFAMTKNFRLYDFITLQTLQLYKLYNSGLLQPDGFAMTKKGSRDAACNVSQ